MDKIAKNYITNKIINLTNTKYKGNFMIFKNENKNLNDFLNNSNLETVMIHMNFNINNIEYQNIINNLQNDFSNINQKEQDTNELSQNNDIIIENNKNITNNNKPKTLIKRKKVEGFVDALILAFITGSFIGIIMLNIYSKIVQNI